MNDILLTQFFVADGEYFKSIGDDRRRWAIVCDTLGAML